MLIILKKNADKHSTQEIINKLNDLNITAILYNIEDTPIIHFSYNISDNIDVSFINRYDTVKTIVNNENPYIKTGKQQKNHKSVITISDISIDSGTPTIIAGPCSIESREQVMETACFLKENGVKFMRGGLFKPRTSPYVFQGIGLGGIDFIKEAGERTGIRIVSEVLEISDIGYLNEYVDIFQIGTRNMYNYPLLKALGKTSKPVILKRGMSATIHEWMMSAEYIMHEGNPNVIFCERGIRTFNTYTRNTLDITAIPYMKGMSHLPIIVDPSHSAGRSRLVPALAKASIASGADGVIIEIHNEPHKSKSDSEQALSFEEFLKLNRVLLEIASIRD